MNNKGMIFFAIVLFYNAGITWAADYKEWIPYFPDEMDGLKAESKNDGINMEMGGQKTSSLTVTYTGGVKSIKAAVMLSSDPSMVDAQRSMGSISLETPDFVIKQIEIDGFKGMYQDDKQSKRITITLFLTDNALLHFEADGGKDEKHYVALVEKIKLKKIVDKF